MKCIELYVTKSILSVITGKDTRKWKINIFAYCHYNTPGWKTYINTALVRGIRFFCTTWGVKGPTISKNKHSMINSKEATEIVWFFMYYFARILLYPEYILTTILNNLCFEIGTNNSSKFLSNKREPLNN